MRDVHPNSGGTGDALTMRLLVEARDEALGLASRRASGRAQRPWSEEEGDERAAGHEHRCHLCRQLFPRDELAYRRTVEGFWMRASKRRVPICPACAAAVWPEFAVRGHISACGVASGP